MAKKQSQTKPIYSCWVLCDAFCVWIPPCAGMTKRISVFIGVNPCLRKHYLKKQSQFAGWQIGLNAYLKGAYDILTVCGSRKNKAKQSQFLLKR